MPKTYIDYSNTIIYKITCKDETIRDVYVGHTTNFVQRKYAHKMCCTNININCKLYQVIRNNGGWDNWKMEIIDHINCKDVYEARKREHEYFVLVKATLNSIEPLPQPRTQNPRFYCEKCNFKCSKQSIYNKHLDTTKHKLVKSVCSIINYETDNNTETDPDTYNETTLDEIPQPITRDEYNNILHLLHELKHKDKSTNEEYNDDNDIYPKQNIKISSSAEPSQMMSDNNIQNKLILELIKSNTQLQNQMYEICKSSQALTTNNISACTIHDNSTTTTNTTNNSNNNTFNMNMFLNEKCKDAMNMKDFVNSIQLNMTDLENVGRLGYVEGMSNIFIDNLQKTDVYKRPVHCSDIKRETLYVKENNQWERDGPDHAKMTNAVLAVEHKNVVLVNEWAKANPRCLNSNTRENDKYIKLSRIVTDGEKEGNIDKVIRKVSKKVAIEKEQKHIEDAYEYV